MSPLSPLQRVCLDRFGTTERLRLNEPLARHGTFGVGGPAEVWYSATTEAELSDIVACATEHQAPLLFVGNGTNVLYADAGARGIVVRVGLEDWSLSKVKQQFFLSAGAGVSLPKLINEMGVMGLAGLEWGAGVPGTIGGAVVSNAGAHGQTTADTLLDVRVFDVTTRTIRTMTHEALGLDYRDSRFRSHRSVVFVPSGQPIIPARLPIDPTEIIITARFRLTQDESGQIQERIARYRHHRKETQPPQPSAGSVFKNPPGDFAGRLVEAAGLKGAQRGGAEISEKHANFIVNRGGATAADIMGLIVAAHTAVLAQFGTDLELEVEPRGDWA